MKETDVVLSVLGLYTAVWDGRRQKSANGPFVEGIPNYSGFPITIFLFPAERCARQLYSPEIRGYPFCVISIRVFCISPGHEWEDMPPEETVMSVLCCFASASVLAAVAGRWYDIKNPLSVFAEADEKER